ncbi:hypothetical protein [Pedobacter frigidisoli]|uniref:hypothetical protein n=1 Tax=Pedobacter frigidisoli TaxID=2530455 RepID=UPI00292F27FD|nr:hypothetical protein [Pedobacter frigidisoli]
MRHNEYEFLLNNIYYKGIIGNQAISADIYQRMQKEYSKLNFYAPNRGERETEFAFKKSFLIVRTYVQQAIKDGIRNFQSAMQATDVTKLNYMVAMLNRNFFDKRGLDQIISNVNTVFNQYSSN